MLLRSDGTAIARGGNQYGQCTIPPLDEGMSNIQVSAGCCLTVLLRSDGTAGAFVVTCSSLAGHEILCFAASGSDLAVDTHRQIAQKLDESLHSVRVVLPDGQLLPSIYTQESINHTFRSE